jgi:hypothetical protein
MAYYNRYIKRLPHYQIEEKGLEDIHWFYNLENQLVKIFGEDSYIEKNEDEDKIRVQTSNRCDVFLGNEAGNSLRITGILSRKEFSYAKKNKIQFSVSNMNLELQEGTPTYYNMIWGTIKNLQSQSIMHLNRQQ